MSDIANFISSRNSGETNGRKDSKSSSYETRTSDETTSTLVCNASLYVESHHCEVRMYRTSAGWKDSPTLEVKHGIELKIGSEIKIRRNNVRVFHMPYLRVGCCKVDSDQAMSLISSSSAGCHADSN